MHEREIHPYEGLGPLRFGMKRAAIREMLKIEPQLFRKYQEARATEAYNDLGFHLYYDEGDGLEFIETFPPCDPRYRGYAFFPLTLDKIVEWMKGFSFSPIRDDAGCRFDEVGIALYAPCPERIEAVSLYQRGYYDT